MRVISQEKIARYTCCGGRILNNYACGCDSGGRSWRPSTCCAILMKDAGCTRGLNGVATMVRSVRVYPLANLRRDCSNGAAQTSLRLLLHTSKIENPFVIDSGGCSVLNASTGRYIVWEIGNWCYLSRSRENLTFPEQQKC